MESNIIVTVLLVNSVLCSAFVVPEGSRRRTSGGTQESAYQMSNQFLFDNTDNGESDSSLPPSPVHQQQPRRHNPHSHLPNIPAELPARRTATHQANEVNRRPRKTDEMNNIMRNTRIEIVKQSILKALQLQDPPNVTTSVRDIPDPILQSVSDYHLNAHQHGAHHRTYQDDDDETTKIFVSAELQDETQCDQTEGAKCLNFNFRHQSRDKKLVDARLWVYVSSNTDILGSGKRTVVATLPASRYGDRYVIATKETYTQTGWVELELLHRHTKTHFTDSANLIEIIIMPNPQEAITIKTEASSRPILSLTYVMKNRARRQSNGRRQCNVNTECCLTQLSLTTEDLNMPWIIRPTAIQADYCSGRCPSQRFTSAREQILTTWSRSSSNRGVSNCCVPMTYGNVSVVYATDNHNSAIQRNLVNIRATSCACVT